MSSESKAVFLSYASQDSEAAKKICDALRASGIEVWFDQSELRGGDAWDQKIRKQIKECALFVPVISANTQARQEGYFRLEWRLADQRTHLMGRSRAFLLPVCIDRTRDTEADVPDSFVSVQWVWLPAGEPDVRFVDRVREMLSIPTSGGPSSVEAVKSAPALRTPASRDLGPPVNRRKVIWIGAAVVAIVVAGVIAFRPIEPKSANPELSTQNPEPRTQNPELGTQNPERVDRITNSVVVLPFSNLSGDPEQEYFSDGLTEEILNALARERDLRVPGRASAFSFKGKGASAAEIAKALNVAQLVEGSVRKAGNRVRISVQLTRASDGFSEALPTVERELTDIFALQDEVARLVVERLTQRTKTTGPVTVLTKVPEAYDAYLRGRALMAQTSPSWLPALQPLQRAVELDPQFALAWATLGRLGAILYVNGLDPAGLSIGRKAVDQALQLQPDLPEAHFARAYLLQAEGATLEQIERAGAVAEKMRPNDPEILAARALLIAARGDRNASVAILEQAVQLDPRNGQHVNTLGLAYWAVGKFAEAESAFMRAFEILGTSIPAMNLGRIYFHRTGDRDRMLRIIDEIPAAIRDDAYWSVRGMVHYWVGDYAGALESHARVSGPVRGFRMRVFQMAEVREAMGDLTSARRDYEAALPIAEQLCAQYPNSRTPRAIVALIYAGLGRKEEALAAARKAAEAGGTGVGGDPHLGGRAVLAQVLARFGQMDEAMEIMQTLVANRAVTRHHLLISPDWRHLRTDPRFQAIAEGAPL